MKKHFSIMPLNTAQLDAICKDIQEQISSGVCEMPLFCMSLHPEGKGPVDKAGILSEKYALFKEKLDAMGIESGVLVQSSLGHGYPLSEDNSFSKYVNLNDGEVQTTCCPYDEGFRAYMKDAYVKIASKHPDLIMQDDDFRLVFRFGNGCACDRHMAELRKKSGLSLSREQLFEILKKEPKGEIARWYLETQTEPLYECARGMREGIDSVDKSIPATFCAAGCNVDYAVEISRILAGEGHPSVVRISHGVYVPEGGRFISRTFYRAARQISYLRGKVDLILAECDTIPYNQYALNAQYFHSHFVGALLEGAQGSKRWITRLSDYEKESGVAYRRLLQKHKGFYDKLTQLVKNVKYEGVRIPLSDRPDYSFSEIGWNSDMDGGEGAVTCLFERLGLPVFYSSENVGAAFMTGAADRKFTDDELRMLLRTPAFFSYDCASRLIERGLGEHLGVSIREWKGEVANVERIDATGKYQDAQYRVHELVVENPKTRVDSMTYHTVDRESYTPLFPGTTVYKNKLGGTAVVFAGTPVAPMNYEEGFSFLTYSRKEQLIRLLSDFGCLPAYYDGPEEMYFKFGTLPSGERLLAFINLGFDVAEKIVLSTALEPTSVRYLTPSGELRRLSFTRSSGKLTVQKKIHPMQPVIIIMK